MKVIKEDKPLPEHAKPDYYECYAKIVLEEMLPDQFYELVIKDMPDLQNEHLSIGIEVTSSINSKQKEVESLYVKWCDQSYERQKKTVRQIEKCGAKLNNGILSGIPCRYVNFDRIYAAVKDKIKKLGKYKHFDNQYLFIFSDIYVTTSMLEKALEKIRHICYLEGLKFDSIFILVPRALCVLDLVKNITFIKPIDSSMQYVQACKANEIARRESIHRLNQS